MYAKNPFTFIRYNSPMKVIYALFLPLFLYGIPPAETLYFKHACNSCHGIYGETSGAVPKLQGQKEALLLQRLKNLQQGKTRTSNGSIMISFAQSLNALETKQMANYLANLKTTVDEERYDIEYDPSGDGGS